MARLLLTYVRLVEGGRLRQRKQSLAQLPPQLRRGMQSGWAAGTTSGDGGSRGAMSDETRGSDAAALGGGDARDDNHERVATAR